MMKVKIVKEVKGSDGLLRFACGDVSILNVHFLIHHKDGGSIVILTM